jgi:hypothetical protein
MARFKTILTDAGATLLTQALALQQTVDINSVKMGSGVYTGDQVELTELVTEVEVNSVLGDKEFIEGDPSLLKISVQTLNNGLTEPTPIREIGLFADTTLFAYAWLDGEDTDNVLPPPLDINVADTMHQHELALFVTNQENASIQVSFAFNGFVSHGLFEQHTENQVIHLSQEDRDRLDDLKDSGIVGIDRLIVNEDIALNTITGNRLVNNTITATQLANNSVETANIRDLNVTNAKIANGTITGAKLFSNTITTTQLANNSVETANIRDLNVTNAKIANGTITGAKLVNNTITSAQLANNSVETANIRDLNVTNAKIANGTITAIKIGSNVITSSELLNVSALENNRVAIGNGAYILNGNESVAIGRNVSVNVVQGAQGTLYNGHAFGNRVTVTHRSTTVFGGQTPGTARNYSTTVNQTLLTGANGTPFAHRPLSVISDARDKTNITPLTYSPLDFINAIEPKQYRLDFRSDYTRLEEIAEEEYNKLDKYEQHHRVMDIPVYELNNAIKFIDYPIDQQYDTVTTETEKFKTVIKSDVIRSREEAMKVFEAFKIENRNGIEEDEQPTEEKVGTIKLLRVYLPKDGSQTNNRLHNGFLAQQVKEVADTMGFDFVGFKDHAVNGGDDLYSISYEEFIAPMVGAIQELSKQNKDLTNRLDKIEEMLHKLIDKQ